MAGSSKTGFMKETIARLRGHEDVRVTPRKPDLPEPSDLRKRLVQARDPSIYLPAELKKKRR